MIRISNGIVVDVTDISQSQIHFSFLLKLCYTAYWQRLSQKTERRCFLIMIALNSTMWPTAEMRTVTIRKGISLPGIWLLLEIWGYSQDRWYSVCSVYGGSDCWREQEIQRGHSADFCTVVRQFWKRYLCQTQLTWQKNCISVSKRIISVTHAYLLLVDGGTKNRPVKSDPKEQISGSVILQFILNFPIILLNSCKKIEGG